MLEGRKVMTISKDGKLLQGKFLAFGVDYEELRDGVGTYSTIIMEVENGGILTMPVDKCRFMEE